MTARATSRTSYRSRAAYTDTASEYAARRRLWTALDTAGVICWADKAYQGAGHVVRVPYRRRWDKLSAGQKAVSRAHAKIRALGEQAMATLKTWRLLRKLRCSTTRITDLGKAVLTLELTAPA